MDASSLKYTFNKTISVKEDAVGTVYAFEGVDVMAHTFSKTNGTWTFLGDAFECKHAKICNTLEGLSQGIVDVSFTYLGSGKIAIVNVVEKGE